VNCYTAEVHDLHSEDAGQAKLKVGHGRLTSEITGESAELIFGAVHFGDHHLHGGVRPFEDGEDYLRLRDELTASFETADFLRLILTMDKQLDSATHSLRSLFRDEQRAILGTILESTAGSMEAVARQVYRQHMLLMRFLLGLDAPLPKPFVRAAEYVLNTDLRRAVESDPPDLGRIRQLREEAATWHVELDAAGLSFALKQAVDRSMSAAGDWAGHAPPLQHCAGVVELARSFPFDVDLWRAQNAFYSMLESAYPKHAGDPEWRAAFQQLGDRLNVRVPAAPPAESKGTGTTP
jgi:hypothetical protein